MALLPLSPAQRPSQLGGVESGVANVLVVVIHHAAGVEGDQDTARALDGLERPVEDALSLQSAMHDSQKAWLISFIVSGYNFPHHVARTGEHETMLRLPMTNYSQQRVLQGSKNCFTAMIIQYEYDPAALMSVCEIQTKAANHLRSKIGPPVGSIAYPVA